MTFIRNTNEPMRHPWPDGMYVQGGASGVVITGNEGSYRTAFVEAFPAGTFLRGEGPTLSEAEDACWNAYQRMTACPAAPDHGPFEARQFTNGSGFCSLCGTWFRSVLPSFEVSTEPSSLLGRALTGDAEALVELAAILTEAVNDEDGTER